MIKRGFGEVQGVFRILRSAFLTREMGAFVAHNAK